MAVADIRYLAKGERATDGGRIGKTVVGSLWGEDRIGWQTNIGALYNVFWSEKPVLEVGTGGNKGGAALDKSTPLFNWIRARTPYIRACCCWLQQVTKPLYAFRWMARLFMWPINSNSPD